MAAMHLSSLLRIRLAGISRVSPYSHCGPQTSDVGVTTSHEEANGQLSISPKQMLHSQGPFLWSPDQLAKCCFASSWGIFQMSSETDAAF